MYLYIDVINKYLIHVCMSVLDVYACVSIVFRFLLLLDLFLRDSDRSHSVGTLVTVVTSQL